MVTGEPAEKGNSVQLDSKSHFEVSNTATHGLSRVSRIHVKYDLEHEGHFRDLIRWTCVLAGGR